MQGIKMTGLFHREFLTSFAILFTFLNNECWSQEISQTVTIYSEINCQGILKTYAQKNEPRLPADLQNKAFSASVQGTWIFYEHKNYNEYWGNLQIVSNSGNCTNLNNVGGKLSSFRFVGSPLDYMQSTLTLYTDVSFQGEQQMTLVDLSDFNYSLREYSKSFIITGTDPWTLYTWENFTGRTACVKPVKKFEPTFVSDTTTRTFFGYLRPNIGSVKRGCFSKKVVLA